MKFPVVCVSCLFNIFKAQFLTLFRNWRFPTFLVLFLRAVNTLRFPTYFVLRKNDP